MLLPLISQLVGPSASERRADLFIGSALLLLGLAGFAAVLAFLLLRRRIYAAIVIGCIMLSVSSYWVAAWTARYGPGWALPIELVIIVLAYITMGITLALWQHSRRQRTVTK